MAVKEENGLIIDTQIVSEQSDLDQANERKISKYADNASLLKNIKTSKGIRNIKVLAVTINCRGVWSR